jgi:hypothetical protein
MFFAFWSTPPSLSVLRAKDNAGCVPNPTIPDPIDGTTSPFDLKAV